MTFTKSDYDLITHEEGPFADRLASILLDIFQPKYVVDYGCATGLYLRPFLDSDVDIYGYEVSEEALSNRVIPKDNFELINPVERIYRKRLADLAICLEVFEHMEPEFVIHSLKNLTELSDRIIFTAAQPGQGGNGHINCQHKDY